MKISAANLCVCMSGLRISEQHTFGTIFVTNLHYCSASGLAAALWAENTQLNLVAAKFGFHHLGVVVCGVITVSAASDSKSQFLPGDQYVVDSATETMTIYLGLPLL